MLMQEFAADLACTMGSSHTVKVITDFEIKAKVNKECTTATMPWKNKCSANNQCINTLILSKMTYIYMCSYFSKKCPYFNQSRDMG